MNKPTLQCTDCGWRGVSIDLHCMDEAPPSTWRAMDKDAQFDRCPDCYSHDVIDIGKNEEHTIWNYNQ